MTCAKGTNNSSPRRHQPLKSLGRNWSARRPHQRTRRETMHSTSTPTTKLVISFDERRQGPIFTRAPCMVPDDPNRRSNCRGSTLAPAVRMAHSFTCAVVSHFRQTLGRHVAPGSSSLLTSLLPCRMGSGTFSTAASRFTAINPS